MQKTFEFLKQAGTYYLATVDGDKARVRPFGTIEKYNDRLYFQTGKVKKVSDQIINNPNVEICAFKDGTWLRVCGQAFVDDDIKAQEHMLENYPELKNMYKAGDGNTEVFYLKDVTATFYSFTSAPEEHKF